MSVGGATGDSVISKETTAVISDCDHGVYCKMSFKAQESVCGSEYHCCHGLRFRL